MAIDKIDLSLDDIIKQNKKGGSAKRGGGNFQNKNKSKFGGTYEGGVGQRRNQRGRGSRGRNSFGGRSTAAPLGKWDHDMFQAGNNVRVNTGNNRSGNLGKLIIKNLDFGVSDTDINELFSEFGVLRKSAVHYDRTGRSLGTADVHFESRAAAVKALNQYNGVPLDGRVMQISFADGNSAPSGGLSGRLGNKVGGGNRGTNNRFRGNRGGGRGGGRNRQPKEEISAEDLDKQLDDYITKMQE